jgi:hypothetical protein
MFHSFHISIGVLLDEFFTSSSPQSHNLHRIAISISPLLRIPPNSTVDIISTPIMGIRPYISKR